MKKLNLLHMRKSQYKNVDNFQRNASRGHLVFQNDANFSLTEAYPSMKISCKFGEPLRALTLNISLCFGSIANAKPKYPPVDTINSILDAHTPKPREIVFDTMR